MVEERFPLLILRRLAEAVAMRFHAFPAHMEQIGLAIRVLAVEVEADKAGHGGDDVLRFGKGGFKGVFLSGDDVQAGEFVNHVFFLGWMGGQDARPHRQAQDFPCRGMTGCWQRVARHVPVSPKTGR